MQAMWIAILWMCGLWTLLAIGAAVPAGDASLPSVHLVRVNDPVGIQGYDLKCAPAEGEAAEPECSITEVKASKTVQRRSVSLEQARKLASSFLSAFPKKELYQSNRDRMPDPPVADVLLVWNVWSGDAGNAGVLKRNIPESERDPALQRAVLLLESSLGIEED